MELPSNFFSQDRGEEGDQRGEDALYGALVGCWGDLGEGEVGETKAGLAGE